ncbi:hypothetical protein OC835_002214 [Tilletia horrida]|nr:hypothetical protein OC835_002214 [Tilletia horrida]
MAFDAPPSEANVNNVFRGSRALHDFYDPDRTFPTPLVEIPAALNPFHQDGVHIFAKMHSALPAANVKSLPALNMLKEGGFDDGVAADGQASAGIPAQNIVEYSSGSTVISLAIISKIFGLNHVTAYLSNKTSAAKLDLMRFFGLKLRVFGGPSQPEPEDVRGGIRAAGEKAKEDGYFNPNQYENEANWKAHFKWTARQLHRQLGQDLDIFVAGMGTSGTMTGTGLALKKLNPQVYRVGVTTKPGDRVPGPRSEALLAPVLFPWRDSIDAMEWVGSQEAFTLSMQLCRTGLLVGPSSGFNLQGLLQRLSTLKEAGELDQLRHRKENGDDSINAVFICCDGPFQYIEEYFSKVDAKEFLPIDDDTLLDVDKYRYDDAWELDAHEAVRRFRLAPTRQTALADVGVQVCGAVAASDSPISSRRSSATADADEEDGFSSPILLTTASSTRSTSLGSIFDEVIKQDREHHRVGGSPRSSSPPTSLSGSEASSTRLASVIVVDLRQPGEAPQLAFQGTIIHLPLRSLVDSVQSGSSSSSSSSIPDSDTADNVEVQCPFAHPPTLRAQWLELDAFFKLVSPTDACDSTTESQDTLPNLPPELRTLLRAPGVKENANLLFICHHGNTARIATSVVRNAGFYAWSVAGGATALASALPSP